VNGQGDRARVGGDRRRLERSNAGTGHDRCGNIVGKCHLSFAAPDVET
jgi:hypothetical protein